MFINFDKYKKSIENAVSETMETLAFSEVTGTKIIDDIPKSLENPLAAKIEITEPIKMDVIIALNYEYASSLLGTVLGNEKISDDEEKVKDFVMELANGIAGNFAININNENKETEVGLPVIIKKINKNEINNEKVYFDFSLEENNLIVCLIRNDKQLYHKNNVINRMTPINYLQDYENTTELLIMIVDDFNTDRKRLSRIISREGYNVIEAASGKEALAIIKEEKPDLILLDIIMPDMLGFEVCERIKEKPEFYEVPIIFVTSKDDAEFKVKGFKVGGVDYITKPYNVEEVIARVNTHLKLENAMKMIKNLNIQLENKLEERTKHLIKTERIAVFGQYVQGIIHNMKNFLSCILGASNLMRIYLNKEEFENEVYHKLSNKINIIEKNAKNLGRMINSLMKKSRSDSKEEFEHLDLNELLRQELSFLESDFFYKNKVTKKILLSDDSILIYAIPSMISQIFHNIVRNALDAMQDEPSPTLIISTEKTDNDVIISVIDNGTGIPDDIISKIFNPFFTTKEKKYYDNTIFSGTGLGLHICNEMIKIHNGKINVESTYGKGTKFSIILPKSEVFFN